MARTLSVSIERFPIAGSFRISRGSRTEAVVVVATIEDNGIIGRGECVPYPRYGETVEGVAELIQAQAAAIAGGLTRAQLQDVLPGGAARNALDCALWDLEAKQTDKPVWELAGLPAPRPTITAYTLSLGEPAEMEAAAAKASARPLLKVKLGGVGDPERIRAVRRGAPSSTLIVDANEAWDKDTIEENLAACREVGVALIEQPLPAANDSLLASIKSPIPICADESVHERHGLADVATRYQAINVKLDKTGGLTEAVALVTEAKSLGLGLMIGCMVGTSLAMAPAMLLAAGADFVDLDGPLLLAKDREPGLKFEGSEITPAERELWG
ncbi:N-acetyl-D-Glu racemase DgcA [Lacibacterium aquatile]|uniref:Dipeptide epimerase n=1 Tax=Lacibacterium aquatile TaxID=1168082 RepID=A0ABW5DNW0_9PROT